MLERPPAERFVTANGLKLHLLEWGSPSRTTLLCPHGFMDLAWGMAPMAEKLAEAGYHVVAPDLRGHGDSDRVGAGGYYHFFDYVFDLADLVDAVARERLVIVGHSMGAAIAGLYGGVFPERPAAMVLMEGMDVAEPALEDMPATIGQWIATVRAARARTPRAHATREAAAARVVEKDPRCPPEVARLLAERGTRAVPGGFAFKHDPLLQTVAPYPFRLDAVRPFWKATSCPVLLLDAQESELESPERLARYALLPNARHEVIAGTGHMMVRHRPGEVAARTLAFLSGLGITP